MFGTIDPEMRMRDMEFILRFLTMHSIDFGKMKRKSISLKRELNLFMGNKHNNTAAEISKSKALFADTIEKVYSSLGPSAFQNVSPTTKLSLVPKFNPTIFDSIMLAMTGAALVKGKDLNEKRMKLLADKSYQESIKIRTTNVDHIVRRVNLAKRYLLKG